MPVDFSTLGDSLSARIQQLMRRRDVAATPAVNIESTDRVAMHLPFAVSNTAFIAVKPNLPYVVNVDGLPTMVIFHYGAVNLEETFVYLIQQQTAYRAVPNQSGRLDYDRLARIPALFAAELFYLLPNCNRPEQVESGRCFEFETTQFDIPTYSSHAVPLAAEGYMPAVVERSYPSDGELHTMLQNIMMRVEAERHSRREAAGRYQLTSRDIAGSEDNQNEVGLRTVKVPFLPNYDYSMSVRMDQPYTVVYQGTPIMLVYCTEDATRRVDDCSYAMFTYVIQSGEIYICQHTGDGYVYRRQSGTIPQFAVCINNLFNNFVSREQYLNSRVVALPPYIELNPLLTYGSRPRAVPPEVQLSLSRSRSNSERLRGYNISRSSFDELACDIGSRSNDLLSAYRSTALASIRRPIWSTSSEITSPHVVTRDNIEYVMDEMCRTIDGSVLDTLRYTLDGDLTCTPRSTVSEEPTIAESEEPLYDERASLTVGQKLKLAEQNARTQNISTTG